MRTHRIRFWLYVVATFMACSYVVLYNYRQVLLNEPIGRQLTVAARWLMILHWAAFLVPLSAIFIALTPRIRERRIFALLPDLLAIFSIAWLFIGLFVWQLQQPPVVAYPGFDQ